MKAYYSKNGRVRLELTKAEWRKLTSVFSHIQHEALSDTSNSLIDDGLQADANFTYRVEETVRASVTKPWPGKATSDDKQAGQV